MNDEIVEKVEAFCSKQFADNKDFALQAEYNYSHLPLCAIDAVFSIGVKYEGVQNVIKRFCDYYKIERFSGKNELTTTDILSLIEQTSIIELTEKVFQNRQRTSTSNGILKSEAVIMFLRVLQKFKVEKFSDVEKIINSEQFENEIKEIPGQKSGIALKYFFMLSGSDDLIKPDRMILRFLENITGKKLSLDNCQLVLTAVTDRLKNKGFNLTPKKLDNLIWNYQRTRQDKKVDNQSSPIFKSETKYQPKKEQTIYDQLNEILKGKIGAVVKSSEIKDELHKYYGTNKSSVILSDYCYNRYNDGVKFNKHIFEYLGKGQYKYLGENYPYNGKIYHKPINQELEICGHWINGEKIIYRKK